MWGILEVANGALIKGQWGSAIVAAPSIVTGNSIKGDGWSLELKPGWKIVPGTRKDDYVLQAAP